MYIDYRQQFSGASGGGAGEGGGGLTSCWIEEGATKVRHAALGVPIWCVPGSAGDPACPVPPLALAHALLSSPPSHLHPE